MGSKLVFDTGEDEYDILFDVVRIQQQEAFDAVVEKVQKTDLTHPIALQELLVDLKWLIHVENLKRKVENVP